MSLTTDTRPFKVLRANRFAEFDAPLRRDLEYVEQLASQTGTRINDWPILPLLVPVTRGDRRGINKAFFAYVPSEAPPEALPPTVEETLAKASQTNDAEKVKRIAELNRMATQNT